jgi:hypothetical protein
MAVRSLEPVNVAAVIHGLNPALDLDRGCGGSINV